MKRLIITTLVVLMLVLSCAGLHIGKPTTTAEYWTTTYWGDGQECVKGDTVYMLRPYKTYQFFPNEDFKWVKEELANGDEYEVSLFWDIEGAPAFGACFDILGNKTRHDTCGLFIFADETSKWMFLNDFEGMGDNVKGLLIAGQSIPAEGVIRETKRQEEATKDLEVGEPMDICKNLWRWGLAPKE